MGMFKTEFFFQAMHRKLNDSTNELLRIHGDLALEFWIKPTDFREHARILSFDRPLGGNPGSGNKVFVLELGTDGHSIFHTIMEVAARSIVSHSIIHHSI